jgi:Zn-dependent protease
MEPFSAAWLQMLPVLAPPLLLSITLHEFAHARVALAFGDPTALHQGRVSLNPLKHLDPIGTAALFIVGFGWARPVPVNDLNLHPRKSGSIAVSLAGIATNLALALCFALVLVAFKFRLGVAQYNDLYLAWAYQSDQAFLAQTAGKGMLFLMLRHAIAVNIVLAIFNLIPLFPLDGHHVVRELLPLGPSDRFMQWQARYGALALLALIVGPRLLTQISGNYVAGPFHAVYDYAIGFTFTIFHLVPVT